MKKSPLVYPSLQALLKKPIHFFAFGLGSGLIRPAPGTWGSLLGALLLLPFLSQVFDNTLFNLLFIAATFALGCHFCGKTSKDLGVHDHSGIVWDEFVPFSTPISVLSPSASPACLPSASSTSGNRSPSAGSTATPQAASAS